MKNQSFACVSDDERQRKLSTILRTRTNDSLSEEQLKDIMLSVVSEYQYEICVYTDHSEFCDALILEESGEKGKIAFGQALFGQRNCNKNVSGELFQKNQPVTAIITQYIGASSDTHLRTIRIYIPSHIYEKGMKIDVQ